MAYIGSWKIDDLVTFTCNTHTPSTGAATDADAAPSYRVYEDETGVAIVTGTMALLDDANTTGFYSEQITLSAANGFEKGKSYNIYISATVGGITGTMQHTLQLEAEVDANRLNWANVDNPSTAVNLSATNIDVDQVIASVSGAVASVTAGVTVTTNNDKTGYSLSAAGVQAIWDALTAALTTAGSIGKLLVDNVNATISSRSTLTAAQVNTEVVDALAVDTYAEPGQGNPLATTTLAAKINYLYKAWRNKKTQTSTQYSLYADDTTTIDQKATVSDDGVTTTVGEIVTGP